MVEKQKEEEKELKELFVIGDSGHGKSSFCFHLTKNSNFAASLGFNSQTTKCKRATGNGFGCFDTIGYSNDVSSHEIQEDIIKSLDENENNNTIFNKLFKKLDAVCLVISLAMRIKIEEIKIEVNKWSFISKSNLIIIFTNDDLVRKKNSYSKLKQDALKISKEILDEKFEEKTLFWVNDCPDDDDRDKKVSDPIQMKVYQDLVEKLKVAIEFCKPVELKEIQMFIVKRNEIYNKKFWEVIKSKNIKRSPKTIEICTRMLLETDKNGCLAGEPRLVWTIMGGSLVLGIDAALALSLGSYISSISVLYTISATAVPLGFFGTIGSWVGLATQTYTYKTIASGLYYGGTKIIATSGPWAAFGGYIEGAIAVSAGTYGLGLLALGACVVIAPIVGNAIANKTLKKYSEYKKVKEMGKDLQKNNDLKMDEEQSREAKMMKEKLKNFKLLSLEKVESQKINLKLNEVDNKKLVEYFGSYFRLVSGKMVSNDEDNQNEGNLVEYKMEKGVISIGFQKLEKNIKKEITVNVNVEIDLPEPEILEMEISKAMKDSVEEMRKQIFKNKK